MGSRPGAARVEWTLAAVAAAVMLLAASRDVFWTSDFMDEAYPPYHALMRGDVGTFFDRLPGYSGFTVVVGAPVALLTSLLGGAETMAFRLSALPGLLALAALAVAVAGPVRAAGNRNWPLFLLTAGGGVIAYAGLLYGHPEDLLATGLAVGAVLAARNGRVLVASLLLVGAVVSKQWAVIVILPAAMAAPRGGLRIAAAGIAGTLVLLGLQTQLGGAVHGTITNTGTLFHPHQIFWPFGDPATPEFTAAGHGERMGPAWLSPLTRPMIIGAAVLVAVAWWVRSGPERDRDDVFGVLALAFLLRCMLDPWNLVYYELPMIVSLAVWEARTGKALPSLAIAASAATWFSFMVYDERTGNGPYLLYLAWTVPLALGLALRLLRPRPIAVPAQARLATV